MANCFAFFTLFHLSLTFFFDQRWGTLTFNKFLGCLHFFRQNIVLRIKITEIVYLQILTCVQKHVNNYGKFGKEQPGSEVEQINKLYHIR